VTLTPPWTCPTCARAVATPFCAECGERPHDARELTLRGFVLHIAQVFSSVDGRLLRSFRCLLTRPGELSAAHVRGQRQAYVGPFQLFFLANVAFFAVQSLVPMQVFSSTLESHLFVQDWHELAQRMVAARLESLHTSREAFAPLFDRAVALHAKSLIVLMVLPFALLLPLVFRGKQSLVAHTVFAIHLYAFLLLLYSLSLVICGVDLLLLGGLGSRTNSLDTVLTVLNLSACAVYLYLAIGRFYGARGWSRALQSSGLALAAVTIAIGYRFALFCLTLYSA